MASTRGEDTKIFVRNTRMKFKDLLLKIIADLHLSELESSVCGLLPSTENCMHNNVEVPLKSIMIL